MRTAYDLSPLYRSMIGVDRVADLIETAMKSGGDRDFPAYDIERTGEDAYRITLAAPGFAAADLDIVAQPNLLVVSGRCSKNDEGRNYLHHGIVGRSFDRRFELADYVVVKSADYADGLLTIDLAREVPEAMKPRRIEIGVGEAPSLEDSRAARASRQAA